MGRTDFSDQFRKVIKCYKHIGYSLIVMRQSVCLVINPITVDNFDVLFNCAPVDSVMLRTGAIPSVVLSVGAQLMAFFCFRFPVVLFGSPGISNYQSRYLFI